jgi:hypothetical protein
MAALRRRRNAGRNLAACLAVEVVPMSIRMLRLACAVATLAALPVAALAQGPRDQRTYFTFSQSVDLPGKTLAAGTYIFRLADSPSNRHIVQVVSEDGKQIQATLMAIPTQRMDAPDEPEIRFMETSAASPSAIHTWWYPGNTTGHEFIYPRKQAEQLAARTKKPVLTTENPGLIEGAGFPKETDKLTRVDETGAETAVDENAKPSEVTGRAQTGRTSAEATASNQPPQPQPDPAASRPQPATRTAEQAPAPRTQPQPGPRDAQADARTPAQPADPDRDRDQLPATASSTPLVALLGFASVLFAAAVRGSTRFRT